MVDQDVQSVQPYATSSDHSKLKSQKDGFNHNFLSIIYLFIEKLRNSEAKD